MSKNHTCRRTFAKTAASAMCLGIVGAVEWSSPIEASTKAEKPIQDDSPEAKSLGYISNGANAKRPEKAGVPGDKQTCGGCEFYMKSGTFNKLEVGTCAHIAPKLVYARGWCPLWGKKPS